jgi:hypothetical protein
MGMTFGAFAWTASEKFDAGSGGATLGDSIDIRAGTGGQSQGCCGTAALGAAAPSSD